MGELHCVRRARARDHRAACRPVLVPRRARNVSAGEQSVRRHDAEHAERCAPLAWDLHRSTRWSPADGAGDAPSTFGVAIVAGRSSRWCGPRGWRGRRWANWLISAAIVRGAHIRRLVAVVVVRAVNRAARVYLPLRLGVHAAGLVRERTQPRWRRARYAFRCTWSPYEIVDLDMNMMFKTVSWIEKMDVSPNL